MFFNSACELFLDGEKNYLNVIYLYLYFLACPK